MKKLKLVKLPEDPEFNNSAGRLLSLLRLIAGKGDAYFNTIVELYGYPKKQVSDDIKGRAYLEFMGILGNAFDEFISDIETSPSIPDEPRAVLKEGIKGLVELAYPANSAAKSRLLQGAEVALLRMAGSMLDAEEALSESDADVLRQSMEELRSLLEESDLKKSARTTLLDLLRISRNALDYYTIHGARGFREAFKSMLAELMEIYLDEGQDVTEETWWAKAVQNAQAFDAVAAKLLKYKPLLENATTVFIGSG